MRGCYEKYNKLLSSHSSKKCEMNTDEYMNYLSADKRETCNDFLDMVVIRYIGISTFSSLLYPYCRYCLYTRGSLERV